VDRRPVADRETVTLSTRVRFPPVQPFPMGVRLVASRQSLKLASGVRFAHPQPILAGSLSGMTGGSDPPGGRSIRSPATKFYAGVVQLERTERYERSDWGSNPHAVPFRSVAQLDRAHPSEGCDLSSNLSRPANRSRADPLVRGWPPGQPFRGSSKALEARADFERLDDPQGEADRLDMHAAVYWDDAGAIPSAAPRFVGPGMPGLYVKAIRPVRFPPGPPNL
jgi:hypothetical protein